ncbi:MAG: hypothetical protein U1E86_02220 [Burkholderiaceae bacterium]
MQDALGNPLSCTSASAAAAYARAADAYLHAWPGVLEHADDALREAPDFALAHAVRALVLASRAESARARAAVASARAGASAATPREQSHVELVAAVVEGRLSDALGRVQEHARRHPTDAIAASTALGAYGLYAFSGDANHEDARLAFVESLAPHYAPSFPWMLMQRGWARIETGAADEGLSMALAAIAIRPRNGHNAHVVAHGLHELGEPARLVEFVDGWLPTYPDHALMWGHLQWHAALAELDLGRTDAALARLSGPIAGYLPRGTPFMGLPDIVGLLWRLGLRSLGGLPWALARDHARAHFPNGSNAFGELHLAMLAAADGDRVALAASRERMQSAADRGHAGAALDVRWCEALGALLDGDPVAAASGLDGCVRDAACVGGSRAQRSVIGLTRAAGRVPRAA